MMCFIPAYGHARWGRHGWKDRDTFPLLVLFPAAAVSEAYKVPFLWGRAACVDPFEHGAYRAGYRCLLQGRLCLLHAAKAEPGCWGQPGIVCSNVQLAAGPGGAPALLRMDSPHPEEFSHLCPLIRPSQCHTARQRDTGLFKLCAVLLGDSFYGYAE